MQTLVLLPVSGLQDPPEVHHHVLNPVQLQAVPHLGHARTADAVDLGHHFFCTVTAFEAWFIVLVHIFEVAMYI